MLAIAGLIFLMVFLALPALQRSQRDTQRRDDMARFSSQIAQYQTNNRGKVPNTELKNLGTACITKSDHADVTTLPDTSVSTSNSCQWSTFLDNYMWAANDDFTDPGGTAYAVMDHGLITDANKYNNGVTGVSRDATNNSVRVTLTAIDDLIHVFHGATCGVEEGTVEPSASGGVRKLAFIYKLEGSGYYCGEV